MTGKEIKKELKRLRTLKSQVWDRWMEAKTRHREIEDEIRAVIASCSVRQGPKHAGGGGGLGGRLWVECQSCGQTHFWDARDPEQVAEWKALPGKITYHSTGN